MITPYMYQEGNKYWVVYNGPLSELFGPDERCFDSKAEAEKFLAAVKLLSEKKGEQ